MSVERLAEHWSVRISGDSITMYPLATHFEGCEYDHWRCAMARLTRAILEPADTSSQSGER